MQISSASTASIVDLTEEEYFASERVSNSDLGMLKYSPSYYRQVKDGEVEGRASSGFALGKLLDCMVLTPHLFHERYRAMPSDIQVPSASGYQTLFCELLIAGEEPVRAYAQAGYSDKGAYEEKAMKMALEFGPYVSFMHQIQSEGLTLYTEDDFHRAALMEESLQDHKLANRLLFEDPEVGWAASQAVIFFELQGVECRAMIDRLWVDKAAQTIYVVDLKTSGHPLAHFGRYYKQYEYYRQQAFYLHAVSQALSYVTNWTILPVIVAVDSDRSQEVRAYQPGVEWIDLGNRELSDLLSRIVYHRACGKWEYSREYYENGGFDALPAPE